MARSSCPKSLINSEGCVGNSIEGLQKEMGHLRAQIQQGEIQAPPDGRVIRRVRFTGEHVKASEGILEIIEEGSEEIVLYVTQENADRYCKDELVRLCVDQTGGTLTCRVVRLGEMVVPAPAGIAHHYRKNAQLVPVYLRPETEGSGKELRLGSEVQLRVERGQRLRACWWAIQDWIGDPSAKRWRPNRSLPGDGGRSVEARLH